MAHFGISVGEEQNPTMFPQANVSHFPASSPITSDQSQTRTHRTPHFSDRGDPITQSLGDNSYRPYSSYESNESSDHAPYQIPTTLPISHPTVPSTSQGHGNGIQEAMVLLPCNQTKLALTLSTPRMLLLSQVTRCAGGASNAATPNPNLGGGPLLPQGKFSATGVDCTRRLGFHILDLLRSLDDSTTRIPFLVFSHGPTSLPPKACRHLQRVWSRAPKIPSRCLLLGNTQPPTQQTSLGKKKR